MRANWTNSSAEQQYNNNPVVKTPVERDLNLINAVDWNKQVENYSRCCYYRRVQNILHTRQKNKNLYPEKKKKKKKIREEEEAAAHGIVWEPSCSRQAVPFIRHMCSVQTHADITYGEGMRTATSSSSASTRLRLLTLFRSFILMPVPIATCYVLLLHRRNKIYYFLALQSPLPDDPLTPSSSCISKYLV